MVKDLSGVISTGLSPREVFESLGIKNNVLLDKLTKMHKDLADIDIVQDLGNKLVIGEAKAGAKFLKVKSIFKRGTKNFNNAGKQMLERIKMAKSVAQQTGKKAEFHLLTPEKMDQNFIDELKALGKKNGVDVIVKHKEL